MKKKPDLRVTEEKITVEYPNKNKINIPIVNGCLVPIIFLALTIIAVRECKRSGIRLEEEKIKLEQMKDGTLIDKSPVITPDTVKIGNYQKAYIPLSKMWRQR